MWTEPKLARSSLMIATLVKSQNNKKLNIGYNVGHK
jgi:hypothetical protein